MTIKASKYDKDVGIEDDKDLSFDADIRDPSCESLLSSIL